MGLDLEVLQQEINRIRVVGLNAAHLRGGEHHHSRLMFSEPALNSDKIEEIQFLAA